MSRLVVISNPRSKKNRKEPELHKDLEAILGDLGRVESPDGFDAVNALAVKLHDEKPEIIAINGGDGTLGVVMTALHKAWDDTPYPQILLLRGGTMNTVAKNLALWGKPRELLQQAVRRIEMGDGLQTKTRWMLVVNGRLGFWFGNGVISNFMEPYYSGAPPSPMKALYVLLRAAASALIGGAYAKAIAAPAMCTIEIDGMVWPQHKWLALGAGTLVDVGWGFRAFYRLKEQPGVVHALGWACTPFRMAMTLPRVYQGRPLTRPDTMDAAGVDIRIKGEGPLHYMVDGDLLCAENEIRIGVSPPIQLVVPRTN